MKKVTWVRHGPTHRSEINGWTDVPADLSDGAALDRLRNFLPEAPVVSSDLTRAVTTADAIQGARRRLDHQPDLRELNFGLWEGVRIPDMSPEDSAQLRIFFEQPGTVRAPEGESWNDLRARVNRAVDGLLQDHDDLVLVAHMGVILTQVQRATGKTAHAALGQRISYLSATQVRFDGAWHLDLVDHCP